MLYETLKWPQIAPLKEKEQKDKGPQNTTQKNKD
jgi:hypothetical protein